MDRKKYLVKNTALFALNSIGTKLIIFLLVPIYTKSLVTSDFGVADLVTTLAAIVVPIITLNIHEAVMRFSLDDDADQDKILSIGITVIVLSALLGIGIIPISKIWALLRPYSMFFYFYCVTQGIYNICVSVLRGKEMLVPYAVCNILVTFTGAILNIIFLVYFKWGVQGYFLGFIISYIVGCLYSVLSSKMYKTIGRFIIDKPLAGKMCAYSLVLIPNSLMWWIMNASDRLMVIAMVGPAANGIYATSYKIPSAISTMSVIFNQAWSYSAIHEENSSDKNAFNEKMYNYLFEFQLIITSSLLFIIKPLMKVYVAEDYYTAWKYIPPLLVGYFFMSLGTFFSTQYTVKKDSKGFLISGSVGAAINVILNLILIPRIGPLGAAIATAMAYFSVFAYRVFDTRKYFSIKWISTKKVISVLVLICMALVNYLNHKFELLILFAFLCIAVVLARKSIVFIIGSFYSKIRKKLPQKNSK